MLNWLRYLPLLLAVALLAGCPLASTPLGTTTSQPPAGPCGPVTEVDETIPDLTFTTLQGETVRLSELKGKVVLLDFWGMLCEGCVQGLEGYQQDAEFVSDPDLYILALSRDKSQQAVAKFVEEHKWTFPVALMTPESDKALLQGMPQTALPQVRLFDKQGRLRYRLTPGDITHERIKCLVGELGKR